MIKKMFLMLLVLMTTALSAQTTKQEVMKNILTAGSTYYSYPGAPTRKLTPAPRGYKPFYISHYGRHGSRYMVNNHAYESSIATMEDAQKAGVLSMLGKDVLRRLKIAYQDAYLRDGDLSLLGGRQHQDIAERMYRNFPELLSQPIHVDARASYVMRCAMSMSNFCQKLREMNPKLQISLQSSKRDMWYIANGDDSIPKVDTDKAAWSKMDAFKKTLMHPQRLMSLLFTDTAYVDKSVKSDKMMSHLYNIAEDMQCVPELKLSFFDLFNDDELFDMWQIQNLNWYYGEGFAPGTTPRYKAHLNLLLNFLNTADEVIRSGESTVTLRFGHDSVVAPLAFLMQLKGCNEVTSDYEHLYTHWADFKVIPMAGNIQFIFYRKTGSNDILVKILQNEHESTIPVKTDCAPYYHWKDVEAFYRAEVARLK